MNERAQTISNVLNKSDAGWYNCSLEDGTPILLCYSTQLLKEGKMFRVLEGIYKGRLVRISDHSILNKSKDIPCPKPCSYIQDTNRLELPNGKKFKTVPQYPKIIKGKYFIGLPIYPNFRLTKPEYLAEATGGSRFASTWFPLFREDQGSTHIFLHIGKISNGCITVQFPDHSNDWKHIYIYLLSHRTPERHLFELLVV